MMDIALLKKEQDRIHGMIDSIFDKLVAENKYDQNKIEPIKDGITDIEAYCDPHNAPRIMWILKEPWDRVVDGEPEGGGFDITKETQDPSFINNISYTQKRIIYSMQCIRTKGEEEYDYMPMYYDMPEHLTNIAYINLCKMPGYPSSDAQLIERAKPWAEVVKEQIKAYNPDIIITGNIYDFLIQLQIMETPEVVQYGDGEGKFINVYKCHDGKWIFDTWHPSYFVISTHKYTKYLADVVTKHYFQK